MQNIHSNGVRAFGDIDLNQIDPIKKEVSVICNSLNEGNSFPSDYENHKYKNLFYEREGGVFVVSELAIPGYLSELIELDYVKAISSGIITDNIHLYRARDSYVMGIVPKDFNYYPDCHFDFPQYHRCLNVLFKVREFNLDQVIYGNNDTMVYSFLNEGFLGIPKGVFYLMINDPSNHFKDSPGVKYSDNSQIVPITYSTLSKLNSEDYLVIINNIFGWDYYQTI